jgi:hypothetical protein
MDRKCQIFGVLKPPSSLDGSYLVETLGWADEPPKTGSDRTV